jgi:hypothetical protein
LFAQKHFILNNNLDNDVTTITIPIVRSRLLKEGLPPSLRLAAGCLTTETVQSAALSLQGMDDVKSSDGLAASMLSVGDSVTNDVFQEHLQDTTSLFVDETGDALDTTSASQTTNGRLGDTLDVITQDLSVALSTTLSQSLSSLSTTGHFSSLCR